MLREDENYTDYLTSRASVNGLYSLMQDVMDTYIINGELKGDMLKITSERDKDLSSIYRMDYSLPNKYLEILPFYTIIANANDVIFHLENEMSRGTSYDEELKNMHAEAILVRTWIYFYLIRNYRNVPFLDEDYTATGSAEGIDSWIDSHSSSYTDVNNLIADIAFVRDELIPAAYTNSQFFNIASANAMLGEMYLWKNDYPNAIDALLASANAADKSRFILDSDLENTKWQNIFKGDESAADEIMTKIIYSKGDKQQNELLNIFSSINPEGFLVAPVEESLYALEGTYRFDGTFSNNEVRKYTRSLDNPYTSDMPVILYRAADVHLMLAEAYNRMGEVGLALDLLNNGSDVLFTAFSKGVRGRVKLEPVKVDGTDLQDSIIDLENKILQERANEMAFEGKRWYDLVRIATRRGDQEFIAQMMKKKYPGFEISVLEEFYGNPENWFINLDY